MASSTPKKGYDAWVDNANVNQPHGSSSWLQLYNSQKRVLLWIPMPDRIKGRTVSSATLTGHAHDTLAAQTLTLTPVATQWQAGQVTWNNQPALVAGTPPTGTCVLASSVADGGEIVFDVTSLVQAMANGTLANFGWRLTTSVSSLQKLAAFNSGSDAWALDVEWDETPDAPSALSPDGTVVSAGKPVVTFDFTEYGADDSDLAEIRVEVDTNLDGTVDWNSGWVTPNPVAPQMDLAAAGMTGTITSGQTVNWRAYVEDTSGNQSDPSDWASYTYRPAGTLTLDSPAAGVLYDPTSEILASFSGPADLDAYEIWITDGTDRTTVLFDSGKLAATSPTDIDFQLPLLGDMIGLGFGTPIFQNDGTYQIHIRAWDKLNRQATPGTSAHVDLWATVTFTDDGSLDPVTSLAAVQAGETPFVQLTWVDSAAPDAYILHRDDTPIARLDPADVVVGVSTYQWLDLGAEPEIEHTYKVRRLTTLTGRSPAVSATITVAPQGTWLLRSNGDSVVIDDLGIDQLAILERRLTYTPVNLPYAVDILTGYEGYSGPFTGSVQDNDDQSLTHAKNVLGAIKKNSTEVVQFIAATISKPVLVSNMQVIPDPTYRDDMNIHRVSFTITQVGDFDYQVL